MVSKLAKNIAHFFVVQKIVEKPKEAIYAYGMELLLSDVLNTLIVLLIALISHTLPAVIIFSAIFMGLRKFVGGYHANSHLSCMFTLVVVMLIFSYGICNVSEKYAWVVSIGFVVISIPVVFNLAPVPHPNKPVSDEKKSKAKKTQQNSYFASVDACFHADNIQAQYNKSVCIKRNISIGVCSGYGEALESR